MNLDRGAVHRHRLDFEMDDPRTLQFLKNALQLEMIASARCGPTIRRSHERGRNR
jgi:hypothetical protein